jgi:hypothetical protein
MTGQTVPLNRSSTLIGRAPNCDLKIASASISKEHTKIEVFEDKIVVSDLGSRNGTFLNGVQIRSAKVRAGDRIALHDIVIEIQNVPDQWVQQPMQQTPFYPPPYGGNQAYQYSANEAPHANDSPAASKAAAIAQQLPAYFEKASTYIDKEILPGVYKLPEIFDFKWVLAGFMGLFILLVTSLSTIPMIRIMKGTIENEGQQHALTIATTLARVNRPALMQGMDSAVSVDIALSRPGVKKAFILSNVDGNVIAPAALAGTYPDLPFIHEARKLNKESVKQIDDSTVVALVPIEFYNAETGTQAITAYAAVFYDMGAIAIDNSEVLSLFITTLFIAFMVGSLLFYFLFKVVEHPFRSLNEQLDQAMKEGHDSVVTTYRFPALQTLANNVSSMLTRSMNGAQESGGRAIEHDRGRELMNLVELVGFAAMGINSHDLRIAAVNQAFETRTGMTAAQSVHMTVNEISDQALKLSVKDLIDRLDAAPDELASNELEFGGVDYQIIAQGIFGTSKLSYYLIVLLPKEENS